MKRISVIFASLVVVVLLDRGITVAQMSDDYGSRPEPTPGVVDPNGPLSLPHVRASLRLAWEESLSGTVYRLEQGGWIVRYSGLIGWMRALVGLSRTSVIRAHHGGSRAIVFFQRPIFGTVIGAFHTHPKGYHPRIEYEDKPYGSYPEDWAHDRPHYVISGLGVSRINHDGSHNFLGSLDSVLSAVTTVSATCENAATG